ncbi:MAG: hypothetical protein ABIW49_07010 [Knoellia sp.]
MKHRHPSEPVPPSDPDRRCSLGCRVLLRPGQPCIGRTSSCRPCARDRPLPDGIRPEGITSGPGTRFYVGSLADGRIVAGDLLTATSTTLLAGETGRALRGLFWDERTDLVWAVGNVGSEAPIWAVDGTTGAVVQDTVVTDGVFLNDLVVTSDTVWVTDSRVVPDRLTALALTSEGAPTGALPTFVPLAGDWPAGDGTAVNANGIRALPDGSLILNNSRVGGLWQVDPATGEAAEIPVSGGPGIVGGDGLALDGSTLYNVRGSGQAEVSVVELVPVGSAWAARWRGARTDETLDVPSTATLAGGWLWAVSARFGVASPGTATYWITRLPAR